MVGVRRTLSVVFCLVAATLACSLALNVFLADGAQWPDYVRIPLLAVSTAWLAWGAALAFNGLLSRRRRSEPAMPQAVPFHPSSRTAVLVPVYNEDPVKTFSHVAAMAQELLELGAGEAFDFAVLSDTNQEQVAQREEFWFARLRAEFGDDVRIYYRRRRTNVGKKAGNVADFIRTSGGLYDYLLMLDADSLMEGATMLEMVRRMDRDPQLGLLQTLPKIIHARSFFGRAIQFGAACYSPVYAGGIAAMQGTEGPYWGHNAIVRTTAFAQSCGLPELPGKPPLGGHILSHDYVEAALLARNGWKVQLDPDLEGSFEEGPDNAIDFAKRDRRWCQGNLQHSRVVTAQGLSPWSRFVFVQNIMAYVASPIWALFLAVSIIAPSVAGDPNYFPEPGQPVFPKTEHVQALTLLTGVFGLLIGPKLLIVLRGAVTGVNRAFGGTLRVALSSLVEILVSSMLAPIMLLYQCRSVFQVLFGLDSGWPTADREASAVGFAEAFAASWWISATGIVTLGAVWQLAPELAFWVMFVAVPAIVAPLLIQASSRPAGGSVARLAGLLRTPAETAPPQIVRSQEAILQRWRSDSATGAEHEVPSLLEPRLDG